MEETIGSRIKKLRAEKELTQDDLARKAGIPNATLMKIENDTVKNPTINTLKKIASALNVTIDLLVSGKNEYDN